MRVRAKGGQDQGTEPHRPRGRVCLKNGAKNRGLDEIRDKKSGKIREQKPDQMRCWGHGVDASWSHPRGERKDPRSRSRCWLFLGAC